ncbi:putative membrane protein [Frankia canadensis]|uniref:GDT1 family protein n=1 Tax=Frankia canadensis TaxID=1836972 RepID=A0A2I2KWI2_9ACTN|nr:TMEM165/GDT1 family protein [Frankia canadensis]SNQ50014.1 putative membrane protein [Frankia canadensis]SOU57304.1 putative membrane protein [Frankia canadensis]
MSITAALVTFGVIFLAELPDKTMVASLVLGSRFRPLYVWVGVAAAFVIHVTVAVAAGSAFSLLPNRLVDAITALLFLAGAVLVLREGHQDGEPAGTQAGAAATPASPEGAEAPAPGRATATATPFWRVAATSFGVVFLAELGDLTQISTANLAARFDAPVAVWLGAVLALWTVAGLAIAGGRGLLRLIPISMITRIAAAAFLVLAVISGIEVVRG